MACLYLMMHIVGDFDDIRNYVVRGTLLWSKLLGSLVCFFCGVGETESGAALRLTAHLCFDAALHVGWISAFSAECLFVKP